MKSSNLDAGILKKCFIAGAKNLDLNKSYINELNVFPVPDGDTGTNMSMTVMTAAMALEELEDDGMEKVTKTMASGSLRGARGNSGVIMSQLIRGFCKTIGQAEDIDPVLFADAFSKGVETAYKAVMKPKEGTILTVARSISEKAGEIAPESDNVYELIKESLESGKEALKMTPELLPVLKEAGVVDSGGQGLITFLEGAINPIGVKHRILKSGLKDTKDYSSYVVNIDKRISTDDIKFGYCTEFIVNLEEPLDAEGVSKFKDYLESIGDSIVCVADEEMIKIHVHTNHPGLAIEEGIKIGASLSNLKIDNMREEHEEKLIKNASRIAAMEKLGENSLEIEKSESAFIAICTGKGFENIFRELGAKVVLEGGQTMNPSTEDILNAIKNANAKNVFILPNNKNIILAAKQAAAIANDCKVYVVPSKNIPQGITALINYNEGVSAEDNINGMLESMASVKTGELTYAVRNTIIDGADIKEGDIMGIGDRGILAVGEILNDTAAEMLDKMIDSDTSIVTIYAGQDVDDEAACLLAERIQEKYPDIEVETERGDQPVYYYIVSVE